MGKSRKSYNGNGSNSNDARTALQKLKAISNFLNNGSDFLTFPTSGVASGGNSAENATSESNPSGNEDNRTGTFVNQKAELECLEYKLSERTTKQVSEARIILNEKIDGVEKRLLEKVSQEKSSTLLWAFGIVFTFTATAFWQISGITEKVTMQLERNFREDNSKNIRELFDRFCDSFNKSATKTINRKIAQGVASITALVPVVSSGSSPVIQVSTEPARVTASNSN